MQFVGWCGQIDCACWVSEMRGNCLVPVMQRDRPIEIDAHDDCDLVAYGKASLRRWKRRNSGGNEKYSK